MTCGLPINEAARQLGVHRRTLTSWIDRGAPVVRQGRRGRGAPTLVDPAAVRAWRAAQEPVAHGINLDQLADLLARAALDVLAHADGNRRDLARALQLMVLLTAGGAADSADALEPEMDSAEWRALTRAAK